MTNLQAIFTGMRGWHNGAGCQPQSWRDPATGNFPAVRRETIAVSSIREWILQKYSASRQLQEQSVMSTSRRRSRAALHGIANTISAVTGRVERDPSGTGRVLELRRSPMPGGGLVTN